MSGNKHIVLYASYAVIALAAGVVLPSQFDSIDGLMGFFVAQVVFVGGALLHEVLFRRAWENKTTRQLKALKYAYDALQDDLSHLRDDTMQILRALKMRATSSPKTPSGNHEPLDLSQPVAGSRERGGEAELYAIAGRTPHAAPRLKVHVAHVTPTKNVGNRVLDEVRMALAKGNLVHKVQPTVDIDSRVVRYYECFTHLLSSDGSRHISPGEYIPIAEEADLMGGVEKVVFANAMGMFSRLQSIGKASRIFINLSAGMVSNPDLFDRMVSFVQSTRGLDEFVVLEVSQGDINTGRINRRDLMNIGKLGFDLSLDHVNDVNIDAPTMVLQNFKFIKVPFSLIEGAIGNPRSFSGREFASFKRSMDNSGIQVIAEKLESTRDARRALSVGIKLGQGFVFGAPEHLEMVADLKPPPSARQIVNS